MHFLSAGRDDRVNRWIADQYPHCTLPLGENTGQWQDSLEDVHRKDHDAMVDMDWEFEELERQVALTAGTCAQEHWLEVKTITGCFDVVSHKRASQITAISQEVQMEVEEKQSISELPVRPLDRRREGRIISQPFVLAPVPQDPSLLPPPILQRLHTIPPPISIDRLYRTSDASSAVPPIAFILQESRSPLPSAMHFTPTAVDLDAFPTTPRSFVSFAPELRNSEERARPPPELFLSPRLQSVYSTPSKTLLTPSTSTPHSSYSVTSQSSTPSLSAFPATPRSPFPSPSHRIRPSSAYVKNVPPVPALPPPKCADPFPTLSGPSLNLDKPRPSVVTSKPTPSYTPLPRKRSHTLPSSSAASPLPNCRDEEASESERSVGGHLSSRMSIRSSRFSLCSDDPGEQIANKSKPWAHLRARAYTTASMLSKGGFATHSRANSRADPHSRTGSHSEIHPRANSRTDALPRSNPRQETVSRANSRSGTHSRANSRAETLFRANSRSETVSRVNSRPETFAHANSVSRANRAETIFHANSRAETGFPANPRPQMPSRTGSSPIFNTLVQTVQEQSQPTGNPQTCTVNPATSMRTLMRSISHSIKRSMSQGSQSKRPSKIQMQRRPSVHNSRVILDDNREDGPKRKGDLGALAGERIFVPMSPPTPASAPLPPSTPAAPSRSGVLKTSITSSPAVGISFGTGLAAGQS